MPPRPGHAQPLLRFLPAAVGGAGFALVFVGAIVACGSEVGDGTSDDGGGAGGGDGSAEAGPGGGLAGDGGALGEGGYRGGDGAPGTCIPLVVDGGVSPKCANCLDDDGDGLIDELDPECSGPRDDDEATFGTGIPGDNQDACKQDCFFDGNSGSGDDRCTWDLRCDAKNVAGTCPYDPDYKNCPGEQPDACRTFCAPLAPNGCDCFGCCTVPRPDGGTANVRLSTTCSAGTLDDPTKCTTCTPSTACANPCDTCELCLGKTTLPPECAAAATDGGAANTCTGGVACNAATPCAQGSYCLTGCCVAEPIVR